MGSSKPDTNVFGSFSSSKVTTPMADGGDTTDHVPIKFEAGAGVASNCVGVPKQMVCALPALVTTGASVDTLISTVDSAEGEQAFPPEMAY